MGNFFIRRPIVAIVLSIIIVILGYVAVQKVPVSQYPEITPPTINIDASYLGANALNVEQAVATIIEQKVNGVEKMLYMKSTNTSDGAMNLQVSFEVGTNLDNANMLTQNKVKQAEPFMPPAVKQTGINIKKSLSFPLMLVSLTSDNPRYDDRFLSNYANINIVDVLSRINGVGEIKLFGGADYAMRIWLKPDVMQKLGLTVDDVKKALQEQNVISPGGKFGAEPAPKGTELTYGITLQERLKGEAEFANIIVKSKEDGSVVRVRDIGSVTLGTENYSSKGYRNSKASAIVAVYQIPGSNALDVATKVKNTMAELEERFPADISQKVSLDTTLAVSEGINEILHTLLEAVGLVILVVFIFLQNWRATLIPLLTVPVSLIGTLAVFPLLGFSVNVLSLLGLVLAIGIVVDDAIVVVEAVMHHIEHGKTPKEATEQAMKEVSGPVVAIALILIAVFVPVALTPGITGLLYQQFAITIAVSVALSALNALTLSPALSAMLLKPTKPLSEQKGLLPKFFNAFNNVFNKLTNGYTGVAGYLAKKSLRVILIIAVLIGAAALLGKRLPGGFLPEEDQGYFMLNLSMPNATSLQRTEQVCRQIEKILSEEEAIEDYMTISGFSMLTNAYQPNVAFFFVSAKEWAERKETVADLIRKLNAKLAVQITTGTAFAFGPPPIPGLGTSAGFTMFLQDMGGNSPDYLQTNAMAFMEAAKKRPEIGSIRTTFNSGSPQMKVEIDRDKAMKLGVPLDKLTSTFGAMLGGSYVNDFNRFGRQYKVYIQAEPEFRVSPDNLQSIYVRNNNGDMVPLTTLLTIHKVSGPEFTNRFNLYRSAEIAGTPTEGYSSSQALKALEEVAAEVLPKDMGYSWSNMSYQEKKAEGSAGTIFLMALVFVFLILAAQYESWKLPFSVLLGTPFAVFGAFLGLSIAHFSNNEYLNNVFAQIGLVMLIGLAAKNAILIVEFAKMEYEQGKPLFESAMASAKLRFRPILMTAFAFILGVVPLLTASGAGAQARKVMGMAVFSGMLLATILGVLLIPALFVMIEKFGRKKNENGTEPSAKEVAK
ncbi:MAG TPA: multidrug efflux RND transporter permease subunit [Bacteroidia bacterium]|nr:multidrug efflux RND transporter permease subunit [Bacteroidia bacterium]